MLVLSVLSSSAQTPIEEFTPTPAFPALQYLESVDEGGVAWRAGLRMGDFLIEVLTGTVVVCIWDCRHKLNFKSLILIPNKQAGMPCAEASFRLIN